MKALLLFFTVILASSVMLYSQNKPTTGTKGVWALKDGNFEVDDIYGNTHNLDEYLDAGKTVIIDFSATWCSSCWQLHQSGVLDDLHNIYGPEGSNELVVFWIESTGAPLSRIQGEGVFTIGDWTIGGTWPVPIISNSEIKEIFHELYDNTIPAVYMICPSGYYKEVTREALWYPDASAVSVYNQIGSCPVNGQLPVAEVKGFNDEYINTDVDFSASIVSADPIISYSWTFPGGTPEISSDAEPTVSWQSPGTYQISLIVTNETGSGIPATKNITIHEVPVVDNMFITFDEILINHEFPKSTFPYEWTTYDADEGPVFNLHSLSQFGITAGAPNTFLVYSKKLLMNWSHPNAYSGTNCAIAVGNDVYPYDVPSNIYNDDWLISPLVTLKSNSSLRLYVRALGQDDIESEEYKIGVSTTNNEPGSFIFIGDTRSVNSPNWSEVNVDLSEYDGQSVYVGVNYVSRDGYAFMVDDIAILTEDFTNSDEATTGNINVYPNPANNIINITSAKNANIRILNLVGQEYINLTGTSENQKIDISVLPQGVYIVQITKDSIVTTKKINISK
ncbi:MAG: choice-of-anchor J domain-containing protein [Bacteroidales bacterium]|jgi:hypothetical protein|nr:choice-of-anchor J domain-containing protein [Bacteroidales bacterium]